MNLFKKKSYEKFFALKDVSFEVKKGEFFGILGRNGSGKSTLLKILAGVYTANGGSVNIRGLVSPFLELGIGFNPELSGRDNIYLNATVLGLTEKQIDEKFDSIVAFSELERFIDQKIKNYSSGMQVRLAFSVAIHANREILLMDEVLAVGDSNFQSKCLREFARYKEMGKTVILVTHDIATVQRYCDRAMLLREGVVALVGTAEEVGNEYVYQNMSDEERRIEREQKRARMKAEKDLALAQKAAEALKGKTLEEERRRLEKEKDKMEEELRRQVEERRNKVAEVVRVEFSDRDGKVKNVFETGEILNVRVVCEFRKSHRDPIFGIVIRDETKRDVFALNTMHQMIDTGVIKQGITTIVFSINNYFATGSYTVSPAIARKDQSNIDWKDNIKSFQIINRKFKSNAIADFETNISISYHGK